MSEFDKIVDRSNTNSIKWTVPKLLTNEDDVVPMWVADMDFEVAPTIQKALEKRMENHVYGYTEASDEMFNNVIRWYKERHNYEFTRDDLVLTTGVVPSISLAIRLFSNEDDMVIIPTPAYQPFVNKTKINNRVPLFTKMVYKEGRYCIDFDDLEQKMNDSVKIFILCNPQNPTGTVFTKSEIGQIAEFCQKHNLKIISDEIHADFIFNNACLTPIIDYNEYTKDNTISLISVGKTFNIAGIKISCSIIKNPILRAEFKRQVEICGIDDINLFAYVAFESAYLKETGAWFDRQLAYIDANREFAVKFIEENLPMVKSYKPDGTYFLWLDFRGCNIPCSKVHEVLLKEAKVMFNRGTFFGEDYEGFERCNLGCPKSQVEKALNQIKNIVDKYCK